MTPEQLTFLETLREALDAQPKNPDYSDYEVRGLITKSEFNDQAYEYNLVEDIRKLLK